MPKIITVTCEICEADITKSSRAEISWIDNYTRELSRTLYFCGREHMYQFLDERRPKEPEAIE